VLLDWECSLYRSILVNESIDQFASWIGERRDIDLRPLFRDDTVLGVPNTQGLLYGGTASQSGGVHGHCQVERAPYDVWRGASIQS